IPNLRVTCDARTDAVRRFYDRAPFPGYPPCDDLHALRARAERSRFAALLDRAIAADARILEVGCGTGQMAPYLARPDRLAGAALAAPGSRGGAALSRRHRAVRRDRPAAPGPEAGGIRRRVLVWRAAPHAGPARVVRPARPPRPTGRHRRRGRVQRRRADSA